MEASTHHGKVLQLGMGWFPEQAGGLNRVYYHLLQHLPATGVDVRGLVAAHSPDLHAHTDSRVGALATVSAPLPARWQAARRAIGRMLEEYDPGAVAAHFALYAFPALDRLRPLPLVVHFHGPWAAEGRVEGARHLAGLGKFWIERAVYRRADRYIVLSSAFREILCTTYGVPPDRVRIVPGGVDVARFAVPGTRLATRQQLGWPTDRPILLSVRRLRPRMGLEHLIDAVAAVRQHVPEVLLLIAGTGPMDSPLRARITEAGLENHVRLLGFLPEVDLPFAYRAADLSLVPTVALEGFGLIAAESLAAGTPVLVTPVGGLPEVVADLAPELVLAGTSPAALADGIRGALTGTRRMPSAAACRHFAATRYNWPLVARAVRQVYKEVL